MELRKNIIQLWKNKGQILEGVTNSVFKREDVEEIAKARMDICFHCDLYTLSDSGCMVVATSPCCNQEKGGCGCSLTFKTRSLSSECPMGLWKAELSQAEEDMINQKLGL